MSSQHKSFRPAALMTLVGAFVVVTVFAQSAPTLRAAALNEQTLAGSMLSAQTGTQLPALVKVEGPLTSMTATTLVVAGETFDATGASIDADVMVGTAVEVYAMAQADGTWLAAHVSLANQRHLNEASIIGTITAIDATGVQIMIGTHVYDLTRAVVFGGLAVGNTVELSLRLDPNDPTRWIVGAAEPAADRLGDCSSAASPLVTPDPASTPDVSSTPDPESTPDVSFDPCDLLDDHGVDGVGHDVGDDHGVDGAGHDVGDDHGVDGVGHDVGDDHGGSQTGGGDSSGSGSQGGSGDSGGSGSQGGGSQDSGSGSGGSDDSGHGGGDDSGGGSDDGGHGGGHD